MSAFRESVKGNEATCLLTSAINLSNPNTHSSFIYIHRGYHKVLKSTVFRQSMLLKRNSANQKKKLQKMWPSDDKIC